MRHILPIMALLFAFAAQADKLTDAQKTAAQKQIEAIKKWAADPKLVALVKEANANPPGKDITQEKWAAMPIMDPMVTAFSKNAAAEILKKNRTDAITEAFLNTAAGTKVAFLSKTSSWSHAKKPKHEVPMTGKDWIMEDTEKDESTGLQQFQVSVPILDGGKPIGSLIVGLAVSKL